MREKERERAVPRSTEGTESQNVKLNGCRQFQELHVSIDTKDVLTIKPTLFSWIFWLPVLKVSGHLFCGTSFDSGCHAVSS